MLLSVAYLFTYLLINFEERDDDFRIKEHWHMVSHQGR